MNSAQKTYHGSLSKIITPFYKCSHFGTREQALIAIGAKFFLFNGPKKNSLPIIHEVDISYDQDKSIKVGADWYSPGGLGCLNALYHHFSNHDKKLAKKFLTISSRINSSQKTFLQSKEAKNRAAAKALYNATKGCLDVMIYDNEVEGSGVSYCLINTNCVAEVKFHLVAWHEVVEAFKLHPHYKRAKSYVEEFVSSNYDTNIDINHTLRVV